VWHSNSTATFERLPDAPVAADGTFTVTIEPGAIYTFTSVASAHPGAAAWLAASAAAGGCVAAPAALAPGALAPPEAPFPLPYFDDFEGYANDTLPLFTSDMFGAFTVFELPAAESAPPPLRARRGVARAAVACGDVAAAALRPRRCARAADGARGNSRVLRQWTRQPPLGWGSGSSNMATVLGNGTLHNIAVAVRARIESPEAGFAPAAAPYVEVGFHAGNGAGRGSSPRDYYGAALNADSVWFNATHWGCNLCGAPAPCREAHPVAFGLDAWHDVVLSEARAPGAAGAAGATVVSATLDGALLFSLAAAAPQPPGGMCLKNNGTGGYVVLRTGAHRAMFDDLAVTAT